jgi:hypothetical protein
MIRMIELYVIYYVLPERALRFYYDSPDHAQRILAYTTPYRTYLIFMYA